jgi:hypothetical protein
MRELVFFYVRLWACIFYGYAALGLLVMPVVYVLDYRENPHSTSLLHCLAALILGWPLGVYAVLRLSHYAYMNGRQLMAALRWLLNWPKKTSEPTHC